MAPLIASALSAVLQVLLFAVVPFLVYWFTQKPRTGFLTYIGLFRPESRSMWLATGSSLLIVPLLLTPTLMDWLLGYVKERAGNGSILPGWWAHGLINVIAYGVIAFVWT